MSGAQLIARLRPALRPALHTLWQTFVAVLAVWWFASGADLAKSVTDVASAKRFGLALAAAAVAALLSAAKTTIASVIDARGATGTPVVTTAPFTPLTGPGAPKFNEPPQTFAVGPATVVHHPSPGPSVQPKPPTV